MKNEEMARLFSEATPYIQKYHGKTMVVKYGGNAMINEELKNAVMNDLVTLTLLGVRVVLVHGGGPEISGMLKKIGKESRFVGGMRYTDAETMDIVQQVKHEKYMFRDSTGEMLVEIDDEVFKGQRVDPKTKVRIDGELERDFMEKDKVDVYKLTILR